MGMYTTHRGHLAKVNIMFTENELERLLQLSTACGQPIGTMLVRLANQEFLAISGSTPPNPLIPYASER